MHLLRDAHSSSRVCQVLFLVGRLRFNENHFDYILQELALDAFNFCVIASNVRAMPNDKSNLINDECEACFCIIWKIRQNFDYIKCMIRTKQNKESTENSILYEIDLQ